MSKASSVIQLMDIRHQGTWRYYLQVAISTCRFTTHHVLHAFLTALCLYWLHSLRLGPCRRPQAVACSMHRWSDRSYSTKSAPRPGGPRLQLSRVNRPEATAGLEQAIVVMTSFSTLLATDALLSWCVSSLDNRQALQPLESGQQPCTP